MHAAIYCRISKDRDGEGLGVARQEEDARELCERHGWDVDRVLVDNDRSAYNGADRPAYRELLDAVRAGDVGAIVAWHPDRLHRSPRELEDFIDLVEEHAVEIATVRAGEYDLSTASGRMTARIVGSVARHESEQKSERIRRSLEQRARAGKPHGSGRPFGYEDDAVTVRESERDLVRDAAERILAGESVTSIAREWNAAAVDTPQGGEQWTPTNVQRLLTAPRAAGLAHYRGEIVGDATWAPLLDRETWEQLRAKFAGNGKPGRRSAHLLSGIARCALCDGPLWSGTSRDRVRYCCYRGPGRPGCGRLTIVAPATEQLVRDAVLRALAGDQLAEARQRNADQGEEAEAAATLADVEERREQLAGDYAEGIISRREWLAARERLEGRERAASRVLSRNHRNAVLAGLPADLGALRALWDDREDDVEWRRALVRSVVDRVVVHPARGCEDPCSWCDDEDERVELVWRA